ncbi:MAG: hypothetical protein WDN30_05020 [Pararobbsia sp.]
MLIAILALIASQFMGAAYACTDTSMSTRSAAGVSNAGVVPTAMPSMDMSSPHADLHDPHAANLCQAHCDNSAQPDHSPQPTPSPAMWLPLVWGLLNFQVSAAQALAPARAASPLAAASPPPRILFQVFRI